MNRLTQRKDGLIAMKANADAKRVTERLCEYEDLEMTPSEIEEMRLALCDLEAQLPNVGKEDAENQAPKAYSRADILNTAMMCVCGDREQDYGSPESSFRMIAALWEPFLKQKCVETGAKVIILPEDVAAMMCLFKLARISTGHGKADNWVDLAGYAANGGEIETGGTMRGKN